MNPIFFLIYIIQTMWFGMPELPPEYDIIEARQFAAELDPLYIENDIYDRKRGWFINEYDVESNNWAKLPPYRLISKGKTAPADVYGTFKPLFTPPPGWRAGTSRADGEIVFNPQWHSESYYWYQHPTWTQTVAHEMGHVYQGPIGYSFPEKTEWSAQIIAMEILASSDHPYAEAALVAQFREMIISTVLYESVDPRWLLDRLQLQGNEYDFYNDLITQCEISESMCDKRANSYYRTPLLMVLDDTDGIIEDAATQSGTIVIDDVKKFIEDNFGVYYVQSN